MADRPVNGGVTERLRALVAVAPPGTLVPIEALADLLRHEADPAAPGALDDLTLAEAGDIVGRRPSTVRNWCGGGKVEGAYRLNGREWRIPRLALRRFLDAQVDAAGSGSGVRREQPANLGRWREHTRR